MGLKEIMMAKGKSDMDPMRKNAKMDMLEELKRVMSSQIGSPLAGLKKVTVAAPDKAGMEMGLEKAKEMLGDAGSDKKSGDEMMDSSKEESAESPEEEDAEMEMPESSQDVDKMIELLLKHKEELKHLGK